MPNFKQSTNKNATIKASFHIFIRKVANFSYLPMDFNQKMVYNITYLKTKIKLALIFVEDKLPICFCILPTKGR